MTSMRAGQPARQESVAETVARVPKMTDAELTEWNRQWFSGADKRILKATMAEAAARAKSGKKVGGAPPAVPPPVKAVPKKVAPKKATAAEQKAAEAEAARKKAVAAEAAKTAAAEQRRQEIAAKRKATIAAKKEAAAKKKADEEAAAETARKKGVIAELRRKAAEKKKADAAKKKAAEPKKAVVKKAAEPQEPEHVAGEPFKTIKGAEQYVSDHPAEFGTRRMNLSGLSIEAANRVVNLFRELRQTYPLSVLVEVTTDTRRHPMGGNALSGKAFADYLSVVNGNVAAIRFHAVIAQNEKIMQNACNGGWKGEVTEKLKVWDNFMAAWKHPSASDLKTYGARRNKVAAIAKFERSNVAPAGKFIEAVLTHEYGHHVHVRAGAASLLEWEKAYSQMCKTGDIHKVSHYAWSGRWREGFAEAFAMYHLGERGKLPAYALKALEGVIASAKANDAGEVRAAAGRR